MHRTLMLTILLVLLAPSAAFAAEAHVELIGSGYKDSTTALTYTAAPGERDRIAVARGANSTIVVRDTGATVVAGSGCAAMDARTVACSAETAIVDAGDGDDALTTPNDSSFVARGGDGATH